MKAIFMNLLLEDGYRLPVYLPDQEEMTKEKFVAFSAANSHLRIERTENNEILIRPPAGGETGNQHVKIAVELELWNTRTQTGETFGSSTGFDLADGSTRSPDAAWIKKERWDSLSYEQKKYFLPFAPDFVVEVLSSNDRISEAQIKMNKWIENGVWLGWLIIPKNKTTYIYRTDGTIDKVIGFDKKLSGENVLPGFEFDLSVLL